MGNLIEIFRKVDEMFGWDKEIEQEINETREYSFSKEDILDQQQEVSKNNGVATFLGERIPALNGCETWGEIGQVFKREGWKGLKDVFYLQVFAGGILLVMGESVIPSQKPIIGPWMIKTGYQKCELFRKYDLKNLERMFPEVDFDEVMKDFPFRKNR